MDNKVNNDVCILKHANIDEKLDSIDESIKEIKSCLHKIDNTMIRQQAILEEHTARSTKLENIVLPLQTKIAWAEGALKLLGVIALIASIAAAFAKII